MTVDFLASTKFKINRAQKHFAELEDEVAAYKGRNPYRIIAEIKSEPGHKIYRFEFVEAIHECWGAMIGDVIHNLRSSLDALATAMVVLNGTTSPSVLRKTYFPIRTTKEQFEKDLPVDLAGASPDARKLVEGLKPYKGGTDAFWQIHQLDIIDKHTVLIPVGANLKSVVPVFDFQKMFGDAFAGVKLPLPLKPVNSEFPLENGKEVGRYTFGNDLDGKFEPEFKFAFEIAFGEGKIIDGQPIVPSLKQFIDFIEGTVDIFDRNLFRGQAQSS